GADGGLAIAEVKSCLADFRSDRKWPEYLDWCDRFYFAVAEDFPAEIVPESCGLILADAYEARILREPEARPVAPARRRALVMRFAQTAAGRLHRLEDPGL